MKPNALICTQTGEEYPLDEPIWQSPEGHLLDIRFRPFLDKTFTRTRPANLWRYREAIPIGKEENIVSFGEGATPMQKINIAGVDVHFKLDFLFPTGSYKDRGSAVLISKIKELGIRHVVQDSSGNAGSSIAAYCAKADIACDIYVPKGVSEAKLAQIRAFGANVKIIDGSREDTAQAALEAAKNSYYASHCWNPFFFQGTKTFAFEVAEQLGWKAPDVVILPAGNGTLLIGAYIGFRELMKAGITDKIPKIIGVQAANCSPLYEAYNEGLPYIPEIETLPTLAEGIAIAKPVRGKQMLQYVELTEGIFLSVSEEEIKEALLLMCSRGYFIEPTSAAVVAGVQKYVEQFWENEKIVSVLTGSGLKAVDKIAKIVNR
ncbi:threonine synthase [Raineya sp.]